MNRQGFLKLLAFIPAGFALPAVQNPSKYPVEIQIEDTLFFLADGFGGACDEPGGTRFILHYFRDGVEHFNYHRYGFWTRGESGVARVVVTDKREPCVRTNLIIGE